MWITLTESMEKTTRGLTELKVTRPVCSPTAGRGLTDLPCTHLQVLVRPPCFKKCSIVGDAGGTFEVSRLFWFFIVIYILYIYTVKKS